MTKSEMKRLQEQQEKESEKVAVVAEVEVKALVTEGPDPNVWWLPQEYHIVVHFPPNPYAEYVQ